MKKQTWRKAVLMLLAVPWCCGHAFAVSTASITISSTGTPVSSPGAITIAFSDSTGHVYSESVPYGQFSSPASLAAWLGSVFTSSYLCPSAGNCTSGLGAHASGAVITFQLNNGASFEWPTITNPSASFAFNLAGWPPSTPVITWATPTPISYGTGLSAAQLDATATAIASGSAVPGTFSYLPVSGTILSAGSQTINVTFTPTNTSEFTGATGSVTLIVNKAAPTISISNIPSNAVTGGGFTVNFSYSGSGSPTESVSSNTNSVCTVSGITVNYVGVGICRLTASATATTDFVAVTGGPQSFAVSDAGSLLPASGYINTIAGDGTAGFIGDGGPAISSEINTPYGAAVDSAGNIYIADSDNDAIREVSASTGNINTIAGNGTGGYSGDSGPATSAEISWPRGVAIDRSGNVYIADTSNNRIRAVYVSGTIPNVSSPQVGYIYTVAGNGTYGYAGDGDVANNPAVELFEPSGVAVDNAGNIYIADAYNNRIRKVAASTGIISTVAGGGSGCTQQTDSVGDGCPATSAEIGGNPTGVAVDSGGNIYIADWQDSRIRMVYASGTIPNVSSPQVGYIYTVVGNGTPGNSGNGGAATVAEIKYPVGVAVDGAGDIYIADSGNYLIREVTATTGDISLVTGGGAGCSQQTDSLGDGCLAIDGELGYPSGIAVDSARNIYIADSQYNRVRAIGGAVSTSCSPSTFIYGNSTTCTATVGGASPTGTVTFTYNGNSWTSCTLSSGSCSVSGLNSLAPGYYTITGSYSGNSSIPAASAPTNIIIASITPTISISDIPSSAAYGGSGFTVTYSYSGSGSPTESVSSNTPGVCTVTGNAVSYTGVGTCTLTANATATTDYAAVIGSPQSFSVSAPTTVSLTSSANPSTYGNPVTFTATVPSGTTGTIVFFDGGTQIGTGPISGTSATFAISELAIGAHSITAFWQGNSNAVFLLSSPLTQTVNAAGVSWDAGTVTLMVSNSSGTVLSTLTGYGQGSTPSSIAEGLAGSNANVNVTAVNDTLYISATGTGAATDYSYSVSAISDLGLNPPSFAGSPSTGALTGGDSTSSTQQTIYSYSIPAYVAGQQPTGYDAVGNVAAYSETVMNTSGSTTDQWNFTYDSLNRLATATTTQAGNSEPNYCWSYDDFGNRLSEISSSAAFPTGSGGTAACTPPSGATAVYDWALYNGTVNGTSNNQISASSQNVNQGRYYDASGDVTDDGLNQYLYDAEGRICAEASTPVPGFTSMTGYVYDAEGNRVAKGAITSWSCDPSANGLEISGNETDYVLGPGGQQAAELTQDSNGSMNWQRIYVYAGSALIATYDPVSNPAYGPSNPSAPETIALPSFRLTDWLGTMRATTDSNGVWQGGCTGLPFGDGSVCQGNIPDAHYYTGKERDAESGNDYFPARYYSSSMGRWLSPDWSAEEEPVPYAKLDNPQSLNLYSYMLNNPLSGFDADGHAGMCGGSDGSTCEVTLTQITQNVNFYNKQGDVVSTVKVTTDMTTISNSKTGAVVSAYASASAENVSGLKFSASQLSSIGSTVGAVQQAGATMSLGTDSAHLLTAIAEKETTLGLHGSSNFNNPLQLDCHSGTCPNGDRGHNIQGALGVLQRIGNSTGFDPASTYGQYNFGHHPTAKGRVNVNNFMEMYNGMSQSSWGWSPSMPAAPIPAGLQ
jgi:RHS repeat-associated protein